MDILDMFQGRPEGVRSVAYSFKNDFLLVPFGDVHLGSPTCNIRKVKEAVNFMRRNPCGIILMGDLLEAASKTSVGAGWVEQVQSPQAQLDALYDVLSPLRDKILVVLDGNHEHRIMKQSGLAVSKILARMLGVPYGGYSCYVKIRCGSQNYIIYAQHGSSNAWYPHTKLTAAIRTAMHTDADIYLYGHTHELLSLAMPRRYYDMRTKSVKYRKKYFVLTGSFLEYHGSYAERKNMHPIKTGLANITLSGQKWDVHVET